MVEALIQHNVKWLAPSPLWTQEGINATGSQNGMFGRPAILRFQNDFFMEELLALTAYQPDRLGEWLAQPETWRKPMPAPPTAAQLRVIEPISKRSQRIAQQIGKLTKNKTGTNTNVSSHSSNTNGNSEKRTFKLYQPAHQRYYLVAAALVCRVPGLPDRTIDPGKQEQVSFVIRRLIHKNQDVGNECDPTDQACQEYAFVNTPHGYAWKTIAHNAHGQLQEEEERLPIFAINFPENQYRRRLFAGLIPVGKRETYLAASKYTDPNANDEGTSGTQTSPDPRRILFEADVIAPWKAVVEQAYFAKTRFDQNEESPVTFDDQISAPSDPENNPARKALYKQLREQIQTASWYILLDFANFLEEHLLMVWEAINDSSKETTLQGAKGTLIDKLKTAKIVYGKSILWEETDYTDDDIIIELTDALKAIKSSNTILENLEKLDVPYDRADKGKAIDRGWPSFLFPLADPSVDPLTGGPVPDTSFDDWPEADNLDRTLAKIGALADLVEAALDAPSKSLPEIETVQKPLDNRDAWFVIRCVYERPNCGPFNPELLSEPTQPFQMAPFFDPDAPARPIRIPMPIDISPAGLRKFKKNATFMISDMLCGKIKKIRKLTLGDLVLSVLPWPFHKDLPSVGPTGPCEDKKGNFGMFCSLSIPIVTLCALILLIIIVSLFDTFFRWIPYLFMCFPIPGFGEKKK